MAKRIQRKRTKGWKMPPNTVYVGRPTKWGNPYLYPPEHAAELYRAWLATCNGLSVIDIYRVKQELSGKDLACWCPLNEPCHADVLLEIANS